MYIFIRGTAFNVFETFSNGFFLSTFPFLFLLIFLAYSSFEMRDMNAGSFMKVKLSIGIEFEAGESEDVERKARNL